MSQNPSSQLLTAGRRAGVQAYPATGIDAEGLQRGGELVPATRDVGLRHPDLQRHGRIDEVARLPIRPGPIALPDPHLAGHDEGLGPGPRIGETTVDQELVEPLA